MNQDSTPTTPSATLRIGWVYWWLLLAPFMTFPAAAGVAVLTMLALDSEWLGPATLLPAVIYAPLLLPLWHRETLFERRHAQQALLLAGLRTLSAFLFLGVAAAAVDQGDGALFLAWLAVNGTLWLVSIVGIVQERRGTCWLMRRLGETEPRHATAAAAEPTSATPPPLVAPPKAVPAASPPLPAGSLPQQPAPADAPARAATVAFLLAKFRSGLPYERRQAEAALADMGEIETF